MKKITSKRTWEDMNYDDSNGMGSGNFNVGGANHVGGGRGIEDYDDWATADESNVGSGRGSQTKTSAQRHKEELNKMKEEFDRETEFTFPTQFNGDIRLRGDKSSYNKAMMSWNGYDDVDNPKNKDKELKGLKKHFEKYGLEMIENQYTLTEQEIESSLITNVSLNRLMGKHNEEGAFWGVVSACRGRDGDEDAMWTNRLKGAIRLSGCSSQKVQGFYQQANMDKPSLEMSYIVFPREDWTYDEFFDTMIELARIDEYNPQDTVLIVKDGIGRYYASSEADGHTIGEVIDDEWCQFNSITYDVEYLKAHTNLNFKGKGKERKGKTPPTDRRFAFGEKDRIAHRDRNRADKVDRSTDFDLDGAPDFDYSKGDTRF